MLVEGYPIQTQVSLQEAGKLLSKQRLYLYIAERRNPKNANFDVRIETEGVRQIINLDHHEEDQSVLLNDFLPDGANFGPIGFRYSIRRKVAGYNPQRSLQAGAPLLSLLHEVGHAHFFDGILGEIVEPINIDEANELVTELVEEISPDITREEEIQVFKRLDAIEAISGLSNWDKSYERITQSKLPEWLREDFFIYHSIEERNCWAYALRAARDLEARGFNVLNGFKDVYDIFRFVNSALGSYEEGRLMSYRYLPIAERPNMYTSRYIRLK